MKKLLALLLLLPMAAQAATINIGWNLPTTATDGTALTGAQALTSIQVFVSTSPITDANAVTPTVTLSGTAVTATQTIATTVGQTLYTRVKACNSQGCSALSNQASRVVPGSVPGVPTSVVIEISISP